jgi:hypothetical protein
VLNITGRRVVSRDGKVFFLRGEHFFHLTSMQTKLPHLVNHGLFISLAAERLIDQKTQIQNSRESKCTCEQEGRLNELVTSSVGILLNERKGNRSDGKTRYKELQDDLK